MFGRIKRVSRLQARKQLLIAASELNRARLLQEWQTLAGSVYGLADRARFFGTLASTAMSLLTGLVSCKSSQTAPAAGKSSWFQKIVSGVRLASTIWLSFRPPGTSSEKKQRTEMEHCLHEISDGENTP